MRPLRCIIIVFSALLLISKSIAQETKHEILLHFNTPLSFALGDFAKNYKSPLGVSVMGRFYVSKVIAITPSIRFDNFINKLSNQRSEYFLQYKLGITYDDNVIGKLLEKYRNIPWFSSHSLADVGMASKIKSNSGGKKNTFAFSIGYGFKARLSKRYFFDTLYNWGIVSDGNSSKGSWSDFRFGFGVYL